MSNRNTSRIRLTTLCAVALAAPAVALTLAQAPPDTSESLAAYAKAVPTDVVAELQKQIDSGAVKLTFDPKRGYLPAVLRALKVPPASQILVFSKTSFQFKHISPRTPRALYFNDDAVVGWVPEGEVMEIASADPQLGAVFYLLPQEKAAKPKFIRQTAECLQCHQGSMTQGVPGHFMRSVYTRMDGQPELKAGSFITTDRSPFEERWGGWYVTGKHGSMRHMGNVFATRQDFPDQIDREAGANVTDLEPLLDTSPYLTQTSDIVALMVAEHQTNLLNLITRANHDTKKALDEPDAGERDLRIRQAIEPLVEALLFAREAPLTDTVAGTSGFAAGFSAQGIRDKKNRSFRDFDLKRRLFRYPCSYLIYSRAFDGLPQPAKEAVYRRLVEVLTGKDRSEIFRGLSDSDRQAILEILADTKTDFAAFHSRKG